tara:strand:- start:300 stop:554 length:255 start_codon:yes stop_codon:yes gene_type:complete
MTNLEEDMERNPEMYKEYIEEDEVNYDVEPAYPEHGGYMLVNHEATMDLDFKKPCFNSVDDAVMWAEANLDHGCYNVYQLKVIL